MTDISHDPLQCVKQLRQTLAADKLSVGFFLGAGCPCSVRVLGKDGEADVPLIPDIKGLTASVHALMIESKDHSNTYQKLVGVLGEDGDSSPTIETTLNRIRSLREVAGTVTVRGLSFAELDSLDQELCRSIKSFVTRNLPNDMTPYHALARFIGTHRYPISELFTTNYDILMEQALETCRVPHFDGFVGSSKPFFDQRAIEEDQLPIRWCRLWKLHGSINWRFNKKTKSVFRSIEDSDGDELLIHPSHRKYDESRRMPYFVMIDRLRTFLRNNQRPVALFVVGYSFGDAHLNEAIIESLEANLSAACFAFQYDDLAAYPNAQKLAEDNVNLSVLARDSAVIRRMKADWMVQPATELAAIKSAFMPVKSKDEEGKGVDESDEPRPCRLTIGDFRSLGEFLNEFSAYGTFSSMGLQE
jgi:hypothetical protein